MQAYFEEIQCKSLINRVQGNNLPFRWTINPFRGCQHACVYCFARGTHQYIGYNPGWEFDQRIVVKVNAPEVLRQELRRPSWNRELIALGTACDPYEPAEQKYQITRRILEALRDSANPVTITTKGTLILRDLELLKQLSQVARCSVNFSLSTLDDHTWRQLEPNAPKPIKRLEAMQQLVEAGVRAGVLLAPILPEITDSRENLESVVRAAAEHKAQFLGSNVLHLKPGTREWFMPFLREAHPHLTPEYQRKYRGIYAPAQYTEKVLKMVEELREEWDLNNKPRPVPQTVGQLALAL